MHIFTVSFERKCDFVEYLAACNLSGIAGMSERCTGDKSVVEIYSETDIKGVLATALTGYILGPFRRCMAEECIDSECPFAGAGEKSDILKSLSSEKYESDTKAKIYEYITDNEFMDIPGFVRFRLPEFSRNVTADTLRACGDFMKRKEYEGMVELLRHHISRSGAAVSADITFHKDGGFGIMYSDGEIAEVPASSGEELDMILGMLMVNIPEKVNVYNRDFAGEGVLSVIETVFGDAVKYCDR